MKNLFEKIILLIIAILCGFSFFSALNIDPLVICIAVFILEVAVLYIKGGKIRINGVFLFWIADIVLMFFYATKVSNSIYYYNTFLLLLVFLSVLLVSYVDSVDIEKIIRVLVIFSIISIGFILIEMVLRERFLSIVSIFMTSKNAALERHRIRVGQGYKGLAEHSNVITMASSILAFYSIYFLGVRKKPMMIALLVLSVFGILLSNERSTLVVIPLAILFTYFVSGKRDKVLRAFKIFVVAVVIIAVIFLLRSFLSQYTLFSRVFDTINSIFQGEDYSGRDALYESAISSWKRSPIIGNGWFYFFFNNRGILGRDTYVHAHNLIYELLCDTGIIGLVLIVTPMVITLVANIKALKHSPEGSQSIYKFTLALQLCIIIDSLMHVTFYSQNMVAFYFIAIMIFYATRKKSANSYTRLPSHM